MHIYIYIYIYISLYVFILTLMFIFIFIFIWKVTYIYIYTYSTCDPCTASCPCAIQYTKSVLDSQVSVCMYVYIQHVQPHLFTGMFSCLPCHGCPWLLSCKCQVAMCSFWPHGPMWPSAPWIHVALIHRIQHRIKHPSGKK